MTTWLIGLGAVVAVYALAVLALVVAGRRAHAVALARFVPDAIVLVKRLAADPRVPRRTRWLLAGVACTSPSRSTSSPTSCPSPDRPTTCSWSASPSAPSSVQPAPR